MLQIRVRRSRLTAGASVLLLSLVSASGCQPRAAVDPDRRLLRVGFGMGPAARIEAVDVLASILYAEGVVTHDWQGHTKSALAESWTWDADRTTLRLSLKPGVVFHDDSVLTAETMARYLRQQVEGKGLGFTYVKDVVVTGPLSVEIRLSRPDAFLLAQLSDIRVTHPDLEDVGTGPFRLIRRQPTMVETVRFDKYHGGASALDGVNIVVYDSQRSAWTGLMKGDVDVVQEVSRESVEFMKGSKTVRPFSTVQPFYVPMFLNHKHPALGNTEVRRAMLEALDRPAIIAQAMKGFGQIADGPIWPQHWAYAAPPPHPGYDPASARARLDRAGFPLKARAGGPKSRFSFRCVVWSEDSQYERIALMVQRQLFDVGIDMVIEMAELNDLGKRGNSGDFDGLLVRVNSSRTLNLTYQFWRSSNGIDPPIIKTGYSGANQAFDNFRLAAGSAPETRAAVAALVKRFHEDVPALFIAWLEVVRAVDSRFDVGGEGMPDPFANMWQWRPTGAVN